MGQPQNSKQPQHWALACKQCLFFSLLWFFSTPHLIDHYLFDDSIAATQKEFTVYSVQQNPSFSFCSQTASQKLKATYKFVAAFSYLLRFHTASLKLLLTSLESGSRTFSKVSKFLILRYLFTSIFFIISTFVPCFSVLRQN